MKNQWKYTPELKTCYLTVWCGALRTFLGWEPDRIEAWSRRWEDDLNYTDPLSLFFHEPPIKYVAGMIMADAFGHSVFSQIDPSDYYKIQDGLTTAITDRGKLSPEDKDFDWDAAKARVDRTFLEHKRRLGLVGDPPQLDAEG